MEHRPTPQVFYGSAIAALCGLLLGLLLHAAWQKHPGGPQILFSRAEAAEAVNRNANAPAADPPDSVELTDDDAGYVTPDPLPVTRLAPQMFDVRPAADGEEERQPVDDLAAEDAPRAPPRDVD
jgi:hypothetical protein